VNEDDSEPPVQEEEEEGLGGRFIQSKRSEREEEEEEGLLTSNNECRSVGTTRCRVALPLGARAHHRQRAPYRHEDEEGKSSQRAGL